MHKKIIKLKIDIFKNSIFELLGTVAPMNVGIALYLDSPLLSSRFKKMPFFVFRWKKKLERQDYHQDQDKITARYFEKQIPPPQKKRKNKTNETLWFASTEDNCLL